MIWHEFQRPSQVQADEDERSEIYGRFLAQPFERGWGTTVGNALRRALLSSIPGAAILPESRDGLGLAAVTTDLGLAHGIRPVTAPLLPQRAAMLPLPSAVLGIITP